ncbi:hypothetical protein XENOCAPTIV_022068 [Xenoophorus captivus]|uniref:Uncharacterized protein n=1 Tax=Xenoophorus captivus TaxID=1517983 RepID=A0ABV0SGJ7_9TELE
MISWPTCSRRPTSFCRTWARQFSMLGSIIPTSDIHLLWSPSGCSMMRDITAPKAASDLEEEDYRKEPLTVIPLCQLLAHTEASGCAFGTDSRNLGMAAMQHVCVWTAAGKGLLFPPTWVVFLLLVPSEEYEPNPSRGGRAGFGEQ